MDTTSIKTFIDTFYPANSAYHLYNEGLINSVELNSRLDLILTTLWFSFVMSQKTHHRLEAEMREFTDSLEYQVENTNV